MNSNGKRSFPDPNQAERHEPGRPVTTHKRASQLHHGHFTPPNYSSADQTTRVPVVHNHGIRGKVEKKSTPTSIDVPAARHKISITSSEIVELWARPVQPHIEQALGPLRENLMLPQFVRQIRTAIKEPTDWAAHPTVTCIPVKATSLLRNSMQQVLRVHPDTKQSLKHIYSEHHTSFHKVIANSAVPETKINVRHEASHQCHLNAYFIPGHINALHYAENLNCKRCRQRAIKLRENGSLIPLRCSQYDPPCRLGSATMH